MRANIRRAYGNFENPIGTVFWSFHSYSVLFLALLLRVRLVEASKRLHVDETIRKETFFELEGSRGIFHGIVELRDARNHPLFVHRFAWLTSP